MKIIDQVRSRVMSDKAITSGLIHNQTTMPGLLSALLLLSLTDKDRKRYMKAMGKKV